VVRRALGHHADADGRRRLYNFNTNNHVRAGAPCTNAGSGTATQLQCAGTMNWVSATLDYQLTRRLDIYLAISHTQSTGGLKNGFTHTETFNVVSGLRFRI
jgi:hypothetical protein